MKIVKVNTNWKLHQARMPVALRFPSWSPQIQKIEYWLREVYGSESYSYENCNSEWKTHWSKLSSSGSRAYFIGLRSEEMATMILLRFNLEFS